MKTFLTKIPLLISLSPCLLVSPSVYGQQTDICYPGKGYPVMVRYFDGQEMHRMAIYDWEEKPVARLNGRDETIDFDLGFIKKEGQPGNSDIKDQVLEFYEPGQPVEADFPIDIKFSEDGNMFAVLYEHSDNVIFYSTATYEILADVEVVRKPISLTMTEEYAYVCCHQAKALVVISLEDFSISNYIEIDGTPFQVGVSPGDDTAYIACNSYLDGWMTAVDLNTNQVIYETHDPYFHHYGRGGDLGRTKYYMTSFKLSPKGDQFVCADTATYRPTIFDAATGQMETRFASGGYRGAGYSPTGDTLYIYSQRNDSVKMYRINTLNNSVIDSITVTAEIWITVSYTDLAISHDGSKVLLSDYNDNRFCLFDFNTLTCQFITEGLLLWDPPIYPSFDGRYGICATMTKVKFIDFETGQIYNSGQAGVSTGIPMGVSSKNELLIAGNSGLSVFSSTSNEAIYPINFKFINAITADSTIICGEPPEADVSYSADLSSDGTTIFSANVMTKNLSVINLDEPYADTLVNIPYMTGIKTVPGTDYAIVYGDDSGMSRIISQTDCSILKELITAQVNDLFLSSNGHTGYLVGYPGPGTARVTKINIDGAESSVIDYVEVGGGLGVMAGLEFDLYTTTAMSPDEQYILVGYNHPQNGDVVNIVSTATMELLTTVNTPDHTIYDFAFTDDSKRALAVTGTWSCLGFIIYLDMENSHLEHVFNIGFGSFSADYNPVDGLFYVLEYTGYIHKIDPETAQFVESYPTYMDEDLRIEVDNHGLTMVLTTTSMIYDRESYAMPGVSSHLIYNEEYDLFISAIPGPDIICIFDPKAVGIQHINPGKTSDIIIFPNPATDQIVITAQQEILHVKISDIKGQELFSGDFNARNIKLSTAGLKPGMYIIDVATNSGNFAGKMVIR